MSFPKFLKQHLKEGGAGSPVLSSLLCSVLKAVERINAAIRAGVPEKTVEELMRPEAQLPEVYPSAADLYQRELASLQQQSPQVPPAAIVQLWLP